MKLLTVLVMCAALPARSIAQQSKVNAPGQFFGDAEITIGMSESDAIARLADKFTIRRTGAEGLLMIADRSDSTRWVGSLAVRSGRVEVISSEWTPENADAGAIAEVVINLLARLSSGPEHDGWRMAGDCTVGVMNNATVGTATNARFGNVSCGRNTIAFSAVRTAGGPSRLEIQLVTQ